MDRTLPTIQPGSQQGSELPDGRTSMKRDKLHCELGHENGESPMSPSHPPHGPQFQAPKQQPQIGQPGPPSLYRTQPGPYPQRPAAAPKPPEKKGVWLRRAALVVPALLVGACTGAIGASGEASGPAGVPAGAPTATVTATSTVTAAAPAPKPAPTVTVTAKAKDPAPAPTVTVTAQAQAPKPAPAPKATKAPAERSGLTAEQ